MLLRRFLPGRQVVGSTPQQGSDKSRIRSVFRLERDTSSANQLTGKSRLNQYSPGVGEKALLQIPLEQPRANLWCNTRRKNLKID